MNETWIVFKAESLWAHGWEERKLLPVGGLTDILATEWDFSGKLPQIRDRVREYANLEDPGNGWVRLQSVQNGAQGWMADFLLSDG